MSVSSASSNMSVSYAGSEIPLDQALDQCFLDLQQFMNSLHCNVRELSMMPDQNEEYELGLKKVLVIQDLIDNMTELFKELKSVTKQVIGAPPKEEKEAMKKIVDDHKAERKRAKDREKEEQKLLKTQSALAASTI
jgi:hypothetical protein